MVYLWLIYFIFRFNKLYLKYFYIRISVVCIHKFYAHLTLYTSGHTTVEGVADVMVAVGGSGAVHLSGFEGGETSNHILRGFLFPFYLTTLIV